MVKVLSTQKKVLPLLEEGIELTLPTGPNVLLCRRLFHDYGPQNEYRNPPMVLPAEKLEAVQFCPLLPPYERTLPNTKVTFANVIGTTIGHTST